MITYTFHGGIADGLYSCYLKGGKWETDPPETMWVEVDPLKREPNGLAANIKGNGCPYQLVGVDADHTAHYLVRMQPIQSLMTEEEFIMQSGNNFD